MLRLLVLVVTIGVADSVNPTTIAPALYLAAGDHPRVRVAEFTLVVFLVNLAGGTLIALGGAAILGNIVPDIDIRRTVRYVAAIIAGVVLVAGAWVIWRQRERLVARGLPATNPRRSSALLLGASITVAELPTAFPYFAVLAAMAGSGLGPAREFALLLVFNVCFVLPLIGILVVLLAGGDRADRVLAVGRRFLERRWPHVLVVLVALAGGLALLFGATGLAAGIHGRVGRFFRHLRHTLHVRP